VLALDRSVGLAPEPSATLQLIRVSLADGAARATGAPLPIVAVDVATATERAVALATPTLDHSVVMVHDRGLESWRRLVDVPGTFLDCSVSSTASIIGLSGGGREAVVVDERAILERHDDALALDCMSGDQVLVLRSDFRVLTHAVGSSLFEEVTALPLEEGRAHAASIRCDLRRQEATIRCDVVASGRYTQCLWLVDLKTGELESIPWARAASSLGGVAI
jgi:hypothetical protein